MKKILTVLCERKLCLKRIYPNSLKALFLLFFLTSASVFSETIKIAMTDYEPIIKFEKNKATGVFIEIVNEAFKKSGVKVVYESYPWKRSQQMVKNNQVDAVIPLFKTKEREQVFLFSDPVMMARNKFFYIKGRKIPENFEWKTLSDFKKFKVGGVIGYWYLENFEKAGIKAELVAADDQNIQKMHAGKIDTFVGDEVFGWMLIKKYYPEEINMFATLNKPESEIPRYILFSKKNPNAPKFIKKFNEGLKLLKKSGEYDKIIKEYEKNNLKMLK